MTVEWKAHTVSMPINGLHELMRDSHRVSELIEQELTYGMNEAMLDMVNGPRLRPGRAELWEIHRPARRRANRRAWIPAGKHAGQIIRTGHLR